MKTGKKLGQALAKLREDNGDSRYKMAKESGIKMDTIIRLEDTGKGNICTIFKILIHYKAEIAIIKK